MKFILPFLVFSSICFAQTKVEDIQTTPGGGQAFTLENGMKIIVLEDHSIPNASLPIFSSLLRYLPF